MFSDFPGLGIITSVTPIHLYSFLRTACRISSIFVFVNVLILLRSGPGVLDPLFCLSLRYAANHIPSNLSSPLRLPKVLFRFLWQIHQCLARIRKSLCNSTTGANSLFPLLVVYDLRFGLKYLGPFLVFSTMDPLTSRQPPSAEISPVACLTYMMWDSFS